MFGADVLTFREFVMAEPLPLASLQQAVLEFLRGRNDAVVFGAQAVNAYVNEPRMTQEASISCRLMLMWSRRNYVPTCVSYSTLQCACDMSAQGEGCASFRCARPGIVTWWTCDLLRRCHQRSASRVSS